MANNKVKYGLKNVHYAVATIDELTNTATYAKPKRWPGAVNLSQEPQGETNKFRADNIDYFVGTSNNGYQGDFESALIPEDFRKEVLGDIEDSNGILIEDAEAKTIHFALLFQFEGDVNNTRHVLYNCTATRPTISGSTTEETIEPQTETITITAVALHNAGLDKDVMKGRCLQDNPLYDTFFDEVYQSVAVATYATVTFDTDGGTAVASQQVRIGGKAEKPADPTKTGYIFDGWYAEDTFTTAFDFTAPITADTTVYAKYTQLFTVTFDTDGGTAIPAQQVADGSTATKPADPTKSGYTFDDWYAEDTFTTVFDFTAPITADTTVYAKFTV